MQDFRRGPVIVAVISLKHMAVIFFFNLPQGHTLADVREFIGPFEQNVNYPSIWNGMYLGRPMSIGDDVNHWRDEISLDLTSYRYWFQVESFSFSPVTLALLDPLAVVHTAYSICSLYYAEGILVEEHESMLVQTLDGTQKYGPFPLVTDGENTDIEIDPHELMIKFVNLYNHSN